MLSSAAPRDREVQVAETVELRMRVPVDLERRLEATARALDRPSNWVVEQAIEAFLQITDIKQALIEAKADDFAGDEDVTAAFARWQKFGGDAG